MDLLTTHRTLLEQWRKTMNLVGPGPLSEHYADADESLSILAEPTGHWADLGTGAGLPGIIFAAMFPQVSLDLVDSRRKRCIFVGQVLMQADLEGHAPRTVHCQRVETLPDATYDGIVSRAFAPPPAVLDHADRLLKPGGFVLLLLMGDAEIPSDRRYSVVREHSYTLPGRDPRRSVLLQRVNAAVSAP
ncbi:MAG: 16S rRNA (guanine527-N7)-methyltransferase [bacterium]|jgi:16S rRNA (guanine527-N7)-methyltransferase